LLNNEPKEVAMQEMRIHWADVIARAAKGPQVIATGITPSGNIHVGNMREVVTADAIFRATKDIGEAARLIYIADTYDPLRTVYPFLPAAYKKYVGMPLSEIPDPFGCCSSYAEHYLRPFTESLSHLDITVEVYLADHMYKMGLYTEATKVALEQHDVIADIIETVSKRRLPTWWSPYNPLCEECRRISAAQIVEHVTTQNSVKYRCQCGAEGLADYSKGQGKLAWRVDWPARWKILGVTIEPFGKDHAVAGGSYDTGQRISREVYGYPPPIPVPYGHIHLKGRGKMSSSKGITITISEMLESAPADVLRYMIIKTKPEKLIDFDPSLGLLTLVDEFDHGEGRAVELARVSEHGCNVPFKHMVTAVQIANNCEELVQVLHRSGYETTDLHALRKRARNVRNWLERFAPEFVKFKVQRSLPVQVKTLNIGQKTALAKLAKALEAKSNDPEWLHNEVYAISEEVGIDSKDAFKAIYIALLAKTSGPRAGWFLTSLSPEFVIARFKAAARDT
jgi:lysyl-tRNA synthetase class 1